MVKKDVLLLLVAACFLLAGALSVYLAEKTSPEEAAAELTSRLQREVALMAVEADEIIQHLSTDSIPAITDANRCPVYIFNDGQIVYWSDNTFVPTYASVADTFQVKLLKAGNGDYLARQWRLDDHRLLIMVLPLLRKYPITNEYLTPEWNRRIFQSGDVSILDPQGTTGFRICIAQGCPFRVTFNSSELPGGIAKAMAVVFFSIGLVTLVVTIVNIVKRMQSTALALIVLILSLLAIRMVMTSLNFPASLVTSDVFNPKMFASGPLNSSIGDLILNEVSILIGCVFLFRNYHRLRSIRLVYRHAIARLIFSVICSLMILFSALYPFVIIQTVYNNSAISLDISQTLQFDTLRVLAMLSVLLSGVCSFMVSHVFIRLLISSGKAVTVLITFAVATVIFAIFNYDNRQYYLSSLVVGSMYFLVVFFTRMYASLGRLGFSTFAYLFVSIFFLSLNGAWAIHTFELKEKINNQFKFASTFLIERDNFGEYLLAETATKISKDIFIQTRIAGPFLSREVIRQKVRQVFIPAYFNKYDVEIFLFQASGDPIENRSALTFSELINTYNREALRSEYDDRVYYINHTSPDIAQQYLVVIPVERFGAIAGHIVLKLALKKIIPENVYPELLVDNSFQQYYRRQDISYAVWANGKIVFSSGRFNYDQHFDAKWLGDPEIHSRGSTIGDYDHIALEDESGRVALVSSPHQSHTFFIASFSVFMVFGLVIILVFIMAQGVVNYVRGEKLYFSARIQLLLNLAFFLPLIIVSVVTLTLTNRSSQSSLNDEYRSKSKAFGEQLAGSLFEYLHHHDDNTSGFENQVASLSKLTNLDVNIYTPQGVLLSTSQPLIFENNLLSSYINSNALKRINKGSNLFIETEHVGKLTFSVSYVALKEPVTGELIGILGIPFFSSGVSLERVQINILATILNIFTLIFIVLVVLSYFVSKWLTFPLKFITQSLRRTSLTRMNQPLVWKSDDEIGLMVKEYNQMLYNLSESKAELEQSQREKAWREIAQQVAHEIKNPLTPMKLTLQQLERAVQTGNNLEEKTSKAVSSLLTQVDTLNDIASSFSSFAKMPEPVIQPLDLIVLLKRIIDLHSHTGEIVFRTSSTTLTVLGDDQLLGRTFSNIILNAFQAVKAGVLPKVIITVEKRDVHCLLSFQDNGRGIEPVVAERIFYPHFTTKKSGSGLGLAIARQAIEQMKGRIWFETNVGSGTTFYIELPLS